MMDSLPDEVAFIIFNKVPIESIGQSLLVSKKWLSRIKNTDFISSYTNSNISNAQLLVSQKGKEISLNTDNQEFRSQKTFKPPFEPDRWYDCLRSISDGILCMVNSQGAIVLWNPTIQKTLTLPIPNCCPDLDPPFTMTKIVSDIFWEKEDLYDLSLGLVFDSSTNDYKVVTYVNNIYNETVRDYLQVFSLKTNSWRTDPVKVPSHRYIGYLGPLSFNSVIHWIVSNVECRQYILRFDVTTETFRVIKLPRPCGENGIYVSMSMYKENTIGICCYSDMDDQMDIWVMKEYANENSWTKICTFNDVPRCLDLEQVSSVLGFCFKKGTNELFMQMPCYGPSVESDVDEDYDIYYEDERPQRVIAILDMEKGEEKYIVWEAEKFIGSKIGYFAESLILLDNPHAQSYIPAADDLHGTSCAQRYIPDDDDTTDDEL